VHTCLCFITNDRLHNKGILKVTDVMAVLGPTLVDAWRRQKQHERERERERQREREGQRERETERGERGETQFKSQGVSNFKSIVSLKARLSSTTVGARESCCSPQNERYTSQDGNTAQCRDSDEEMMCCIRADATRRQ